jgi:predicted anti-sigma-YlaC factor YlaD
MEELTCPEVKQLLVQAHDSGAVPTDAVLRHIEDCPHCREYRRFLVSLGQDLKEALDAHTATRARPDTRELFASSKKKRRKKTIRHTLSGLAAALAISLGSFIAASAIKDSQDRLLVQEETQYFVDDLFQTTLFEGVENTAFNPQ